MVCKIILDEEKNLEPDLEPNYKCAACGFIGYIAVIVPDALPRRCPICGRRLQPYIYG